MVLALTTVVAALHPAVSLAQDGEDSRGRALDLFEQAERLYQAGEVDAAIERLLEARALAPDEPVLVYNLARAYETRARFEEAIAAYESFLRAQPDTPDRGAIEARIAALRAQLERERERVEHLERLERERLERERLERERARAGSVDAWPWVLSGLGAAALGTGIGLGVMALDARQEATLDPVHATAFASLRRAEDFALAANVLFIAGGVLLATGLVWAIVQLVGLGGGEAPLETRSGEIAIRLDQ